MPSTTDTQWLISPGIEPLPADAALERAINAADEPHRARETVAELVTLRRLLQHDHELDGHGDLEDFIERTWRLLQAIRVVGEQNLWLDGGDGTMTRLRADETRELEPLLPRIGSMHSSRLSGWSHLVSGRVPVTLPRQDEVDAYFDSEVFETHNMRHARVCDAEEISIHEAICQVIDHAPDRRVWLKARASKSYLLRVGVPEGFEWLTNLNEITHAVNMLADDRETDWPAHVFDMLVHGNTPRGVLVAPHVDMVSEYRLFMVEGTLITGAGCIESDTPLMTRSNESFSPRMEAKRGSGEIIRSETLRARYLARGHELAALLHEEGRGTGVLDLAYVPETDTIVIVELNGLTNAGFYASRIDLLYTAWASVPELHTPVIDTRTDQLLSSISLHDVSEI